MAPPCTSHRTCGPRAPVAPAAPATAGGNVRWVVCALLFFAATINYIDRQVIGILKPTLQQEFGWSEIDYADIVFAFQLAYAIGLVLAGPVMDRIGARRGFIVAIVVWSLAAILHAEATVIGGPTATLLSAFGLVYTTSVAGFIGARFLLGLGEAGNFPAAIKVVAEWFPKRERAFATGTVQFRNERRRAAHAADRPVDHADVGLEVGLHRRRARSGSCGCCSGSRSIANPRPTRASAPQELAYIRSDPPEPAVRIPWRSVLPSGRPGRSCSASS